MSRNALPTAAKDYIQNLGNRNRTFTLEGGVTGSGIAQLRQMPGTTGSIYFADIYGIDSIPTTEVYFTNLDFKDDEQKPTIRKFTIEAVEVI